VCGHGCAADGVRCQGSPVGYILLVIFAIGLFSTFAVFAWMKSHDAEEGWKGRPSPQYHSELPLVDDEVCLDAVNEQGDIVDDRTDDF